MDRWEYQELKDRLDFEAECNDGKKVYVNTKWGRFLLTNIHTVQIDVDDFDVTYDAINLSRPLTQDDVPAVVKQHYARY